MKLNTHVLYGIAVEHQEEMFVGGRETRHSELFPQAPAGATAIGRRTHPTFQVNDKLTQERLAMMRGARLVADVPAFRSTVGASAKAGDTASVLDQAVQADLNAIAVAVKDWRKDQLRTLRDQATTRH